jgi:pimeloyl-ACP methyl ester carboxylesterase
LCAHHEKQALSEKNRPASDPCKRLPGRGLARWDARRIAALKLPTAIILGGRDRLAPLGDAERFHHDVAGSRLVT